MCLGNVCVRSSTRTLRIRSGYKPACRSVKGALEFAELPNSLHQHFLLQRWEQDAILLRCNTTGDTAADCALSAWSEGHNIPPPLGTAAGSQSNWDNPIVGLGYTHLLESCANDVDKARLLAVSAQRSSHWLHALPIASCGLLLEDEAVRVAVGLRLGAKLCEPHTCPCGALVDATAIHCLSCRRSSGRVIRHHNLNDIIWRALSKAGIPSVKEPLGLSRSDGKRPDGLTLIPWRNGRCAVWDVTVTDTLAASYVALTSSCPGRAAESAAARKLEKYRDLAGGYEVVPVAFETLGPVDQGGASFIDGIGNMIARVSGDPRESSFLWQRISVALQRFSAVCFRNTFLEEMPHHNLTHGPCTPRWV